MMPKFWFVCLMALCLMPAVSSAQEPFELGAYSPGQCAADSLRDFSHADGAFIAAGLLKASMQKDNLAGFFEFSSDDIVVVKLTGAQLKQAFERSLSVYPMPNSSFLQISGFEVTFSGSAPIGQRVKNATASGTPIDNNRTYTIAMPARLGRGGFGYFKIWDKADITQTLSSATVESILKGKPVTDTSPRWVASS
jgi:2',3'-cyclic-nucleotide 2'-phosphodiesterase (5'-nucleotidase family)